jgi:hypothetical protein
MNELYRHKPTGNLYEKLHDSIIVDTKQLVVVYRSLKDQRVYVRDTEIFNERFEKAE